jgi:hypothetical protein
MAKRASQLTRPRAAGHAEPTPYHAFAGRAERWLAARIAHFGFPAARAGSLLSLVKPIGELAILADLLMRFEPGSPRHELGRAWLEHAWSELEEGRLLTNIVHRRPDMLHRVSTYLPFFRRGLRHRPFEELVGRSLETRGIAALEYYGWPAIELAASFEELGIEPPRRWTPASAFRETWLYARPEPASITEFSAYSLTHTVFYLTRFGDRKAGLPAAHRRYAARWAPVWGEYYFRREHWDLMSEMVMVLRCLGAPDDRDWGRRLLGAQRDSGLVPGPSGDGRHLDPGCTDPERVDFLANYHPTLVGLMAALMSIHGLAGR